MKTYYFTFGSNHLDVDGKSLGRKYVAITAETEYQARDILFKARGDKWAFCYGIDELPDLIVYGLKEISLEKVTIIKEEIK